MFSHRARYRFIQACNWQEGRITKDFSALTLPIKEPVWPLFARTLSVALPSDGYYLRVQWRSEYLMHCRFGTCEARVGLSLCDLTGKIERKKKPIVRRLPCRAMGVHRASGSLSRSGPFLVRAAARVMSCLHICFARLQVEQCTYIRATKGALWLLGALAGLRSVVCFLAFAHG